MFKRSLKQAVRWRIIPRNPCDDVEAPRPGRKEFRVWTKEQIQQFLEATRDDHLHALWRLALGTGMRLGELVALRWDDIDWARGAVQVNRTIVRDKKGWTVGEPKTPSSRRRVYLPPSCLAALQRQRQSLGQGLLWIFPSPHGGPYNPESISAFWRERVAKAKLPAIRFHDTRHTAATLMLEQGHYVKAVSEQLGHSSVAITMQLYGHVTERMTRDLARSMDAVLGEA
jgi:integrase